MKQPEAPDGLVLAVDAGVATLTLDRPARRNAVTHAMWLSIASVCERLGADPSVRVLVVRGTGSHFSAGADVADMAEVDPVTYRAANEAADEALASFPKPTVAVIEGSCIGGGTEIAVACDLRLADTTARFGVTPARLGIVYPVPPTRRLVRTVGPSAAKHLLYTAEIVDAERALRIGLIDELHEPDELPGRVDELVDLMARQRSLLTQMASKEIVEAAVDGPVDLAIGERWATEMAGAADPVEGVVAFLERRAPNFTWTPESQA